MEKTSGHILPRNNYDRIHTRLHKVQEYRGIADRQRDEKMEEDKIRWSGDHAFSAEAATYSLMNFIEPQIASEHPDWSTDAVHQEAVSRFEKRLAQDIAYEHREIEHEHTVVTWHMVETAPGVKELATQYGDDLVTLRELWDHTREFAETTGNRAAYNAQEEQAQLAMQEAFVNGEGKSFVSVLSHPDAVRYVQVWGVSGDGSAYSKQIDLSVVTGRDFTKDEAERLIHHISEYYNRDTVRDTRQADAPKYAHVLISDKEVREADITTLAVTESLYSEYQNAGVEMNDDILDELDSGRGDPRSFEEEYENVTQYIRQKEDEEEHEEKDEMVPVDAHGSADIKDEGQDSVSIAPSIVPVRMPDQWYEHHESTGAGVLEILTDWRDAVFFVELGRVSEPLAPVILAWLAIDFPPVQKIQTAVFDHSSAAKEQSAEPRAAKTDMLSTVSSEPLTLPQRAQGWIADLFRRIRTQLRTERVHVRPESVYGVPETVKQADISTHTIKEHAFMTEQSELVRIWSAALRDVPGEAGQRALELLALLDSLSYFVGAKAHTPTGQESHIAEEFGFEPGAVENELMMAIIVTLCYLWLNEALTDGTGTRQSPSGQGSESVSAALISEKESDPIRPERVWMLLAIIRYLALLREVGIVQQNTGAKRATRKTSKRKQRLLFYSETEGVDRTIAPLILSIT